MPAEQDKLREAVEKVMRLEEAVELGWWDDWSVTLAEGVKRLEAELLAAQEERDSHAKAASEAMAREKALREALEEARQYVCDWPIGLDTDPQEQRGGARDTMIANIDFALAGSPSEKPGSEEEACPRCGATPDGGTSLDCPVCTGVTDAD